MVTVDGFLHLFEPTVLFHTSPASGHRPSLSLFLLKSSTATIVPNSEIDCEKTSLQIQAVRRSNPNLFLFTSALRLTPLLRCYNTFFCLCELPKVDRRRWTIFVIVFYSICIECKTIRIYILLCDIFYYYTIL